MTKCKNYNYEENKLAEIIAGKQTEFFDGQFEEELEKFLMKDLESIGSLSDSRFDSLCASEPTDAPSITIEDIEALERVLGMERRTSFVPYLRFDTVLHDPKRIVIIDQ